MTRFFLAALAMAGMAMSVSAFAADKAEQVLTAQTKEAFTKQANGIRAQMAGGGRYQYLKPEEKGKVEKDLGAIEAILDKHLADGHIGADEKLQIVNKQEEVNGLLTERDSQRLVCERKMPTGSHRVQNTCRTYGEIEKERRDTQDLMRQNSAVKQIERGN